jgi:hypothetical protein
MSTNVRSCEAAARVKPRARLCEPWVVLKIIVRGAAERRPHLGVCLHSFPKQNTDSYFKFAGSVIYQRKKLAEKKRKVA